MHFMQDTSLTSGTSSIRLPNIDALAGDGVTFENAFAPASYTLASIPSILTGRHPGTHGLARPGSELPAAETTLAELLGAAGYRTFGAIGNLQGSSMHALDQGFGVYEELFRSEGDEAEQEHAHSVLPTSSCPSFNRGAAMSRMGRLSITCTS